MSANLWSANSPSRFWMCESPIPDEWWPAAIRTAAPLLGLDNAGERVEQLLQLTLGEGQFGALHWQLSPATRLYYQLKPFIPRSTSRLLRQVQLHAPARHSALGWPIEERFVNFTWETLRQILLRTEDNRVLLRCLWPHNAAFACVLTHDIETAEGQKFAPLVADLEENLGLRSSFNLVGERYRIDHGLVRDLRKRGFEIGLHGLKHDGKLFTSHNGFLARAKRINTHLRTLGATGFRAPLTHRQPEWMQALEVDYDSSFFDTDPYEPIAGGVMTIYPFYIGHFVELPYTLAQDYTLASILGHTTPQVWLRKVDYIADNHGMALINTHPDYLRDARTWQLYEEFLNAVRQREHVWHALPREVARWWRLRSAADTVAALEQGMIAVAELVDDQVQLRLSGAEQPAGAELLQRRAAAVAGERTAAAMAQDHTAIRASTKPGLAP